MIRFILHQIACSAFVLAFAFSPLAMAQEIEGLEKYQDPPAARVWRHELSPATVTRYGPFTSYQVNVTADGKNIVGDAANEPSLCLNPNDRTRMSIGWRQFDSVTSNFRQGGFAYSTNGGLSWTFPGNLQQNVFRSDPVLSSDAAGNFFYLSLATNFFDDMWRSTTGGQSWLRLGPATGGDKQWFAIDTTNSSGRGFQYQIWSTNGNNYNGRQFSRSLDGGVTWSNPIYLLDAPSWGTLDVDSNGNLFIGGWNFGTEQIYCVRSSDAKNPLVSPTFDQSTVVNLGGSIQVQNSINPEGLVGQAYLAVDRSGTATNNNIYVLASVRRTGTSSGSDVMFARSVDGGKTFSTARRINNDPLNTAKWHWMSTLSVAPNGRIDVVWLDTRNAGNNTDSQLFYAYSFDGGNTWSPNLAVSPSFNPFLGYPAQNKMGDYMSIVSDAGGGNVAYTATFNGEEDIYYVRVAPQAPVALGAVSRKTHGSAGTFDVPLPLAGPAGVEGRGPAGSHQIMVTFANDVTLTGVSVTSVDGAATATQSTAGPYIIVNLSNVADAQTLAVKLSNVNDGVGFGDVVVPIAILLGDANGDGAVNSGDAAYVRNLSGRDIDPSTFRADVTVDGSINSGDASVVRARSGSGLP